VIDDVITQNTLSKLKTVIPYKYYNIWCNIWSKSA